MYKLKKIFYIAKYFSIKLMLILCFFHVLKYILNKKNVIIQYLYKKRDFYIENYLIKNGYINTVVSKDMITVKPKKKLDTNCIWIYWAQGWENPPEHVSFCKNSVIKNANGRNVILISDKNYKEYVNIPNYIEQKKREGKITITHFSDILRFSLLADYGGLWLDASMFVNKPFEDSLLEKNFYTVRLKTDFTNNSIVSRARWVVSCIGTRKKNYKLFVLGRKFFFNYWKKEEYLINYFLIDYFFDIIFRLDKSLNKDLLENEYFNQGIYELSKEINTTNLNSLKKEIYLKTNIYYLSWKNEYKKQINGEKTIYNYFINKYKR